MNSTVMDMLDYPKLFQMELLRHLIKDPDFYRNAVGLINVTDFDHPVCRVIYDALVAYWSAHGNAPPMGTLHIAALGFAEEGGRSTPPLSPEEQPNFHQMWQELANTYNNPLDTAYYAENLGRWIKRVRWNQVMRDNRYVSGAGVEQVLQEAAKLDALDVSTDTDSNFSSAWDDHTPAIDPEETPMRISTGLAKLDRRTFGGLGIGELGMILACPGVGKTTTLLNFAYAAVMQRVRVLFITCEMSSKRISHRYQSISAQISAKTLRNPMRDWDSRAIARWQFAQKHMPKDGIIVYDASKQSNTLAQIEGIIEKWKKKMIDAYGETAFPLMVCLDWLHPDYLTIPNSRNMKSHEVIASLAKKVGMIGRNTNVALWSACQANRGADGKEVLRMSDTAGAYDINQPLDIGLGLAPIADITQQQQMLLTDAADDDDKQADMLARNGRRLSISSTKNRDNPEFKLEIFQGPTLQFWDKKEVWDNVARRLNSNDGLDIIRENLGLL